MKEVKPERKDWEEDENNKMFIYVLTMHDCMHDCLEMNLFCDELQPPLKGVQEALDTL